MPNLTLEAFEKMLAILDNVATDYDVTTKSKELIMVDESEVPEIIKFYITSLAIENRAEGTLYNYTRHLMNMLRTVGKPFNTITTNDMRVYLYNYKLERGISNASLESMRIMFKSFFRWCERERLIDINPMDTISTIKFQPHKREPLELDELDAMRAACRDSRDSAIVEFLYSTGCRVSEATQMKLEDIDWAHHRAEVLHGKGDKRRTVYLTERCEEALKKYLDERKNKTEYVFSPTRKLKNPYMTSRAMQAIVKAIAERSTLPDGRKVTPHVFRHTTATVALHNGMPIDQIQRLLGHDRINTTMIYAETDDKQVQEAHNKYIT